MNLQKNDCRRYRRRHSFFPPRLCILWITSKRLFFYQWNGSRHGCNGVVGDDCREHCRRFIAGYILGKAGASTASSGAGIGFVVGLLMSLSFDLVMYGTGHGMSTTGIAADVAVSAVMSAIVGAIVAVLWEWAKKPRLIFLKIFITVPAFRGRFFICKGA
jgi:hypothetical protein